MRKGSEPRPRADLEGSVAAARGPRVALPSQGSREQAAQETLAGGVRGCWGNRLRGNSPFQGGHRGQAAGRPRRGRRPDGRECRRAVRCAPYAQLLRLRSPGLLRLAAPRSAPGAEHQPVALQVSGRQGDEDQGARPPPLAWKPLGGARAAR